MTPQEKADKLVKDMYAVRSGSVSMITLHFAKQCALIAVDEIMNELSEMNYGLQYLNRMAYWEEVKEEIKKSVRVDDAKVVCGSLPLLSV